MILEEILQNRLLHNKRSYLFILLPPIRPKRLMFQKTYCGKYVILGLFLNKENLDILFFYQVV